MCAWRQNIHHLLSGAELIYGPIEDALTRMCHSELFCYNSDVGEDLGFSFVSTVLVCGRGLLASMAAQVGSA